MDDSLFGAGEFLPPRDGGNGADEPRSSSRDGASFRRMMLFAGRSSIDLAERIADDLGVSLGESTLKTFPNTETYVRFNESVRGSDVFLIQSCSRPCNDNLVELLIMINAARLASAKRITAVVPWFPYARQDKKSAPREPITARLMADMLETAGVDRVLTMDLHAGQVQGFFRVPVDHMTALPMFQQYFLDLGLPREEIVVISPDTGRVKLAKKFAEMLGGELAVLTKERPSHSQVQVTNVIGDVAGKTCVISDDMIDTAGTLVAGAQAIHEAGARCIYACATHPVFSEPALQRLEDSVLEQVVVCDTIPVDPTTRPDKVRVLSVAQDPRRDDPQRLHRRLGVGDLQGREPAFLGDGAGRSHEQREKAVMLEIETREIGGTSSGARRPPHGQDPGRAVRQRARGAAVRGRRPPPARDAERGRRTACGDRGQGARGRARRSTRSSRTSSCTRCATR